MCEIDWFLMCVFSDTSSLSSLSEAPEGGEEEEREERKDESPLKSSLNSSATKKRMLDSDSDR